MLKNPSSGESLLFALLMFGVTQEKYRGENTNLFTSRVKEKMGEMCVLYSSFVYTSTKCKK